MKRHIKLTVAYDGTEFSGFQRQRGCRNVQEELEEAIARVVQHPVTVIPAGRTDAGVHAEGQIVKFTTTCRIPTQSIPLALNSVLPKDIVIKGAQQVAAGFHPRFDAKSRVYRYLIDNKRMPSVQRRRYAWHVAQPLNVEAMQEAAIYLIGVHDFSSFHASGSNLGGTVRNLLRLRCCRDGGFVVLTIEANAFLYHMARIMVGTLVEIGLGRREAKDMKVILEAKDRKVAGATAPPHGLCLMKVRY